MLEEAIKMFNLKEPKKLKNGQIDLNWWNSLLDNEKNQYNVWHNEIYPELYKQSPTEIIIKPEILDISNLKESKEKLFFRPTKFEEYIGQEKAKKRILCYLEGCKKFNEHFPNTLLSAPAGYGKTIFANILANLLNKSFITCTAGELKSEQQLVDKIVECNGGILFLDEAHKCSNKIGTFLLPILEEYKICGKQIHPFTMFFATTHKGNLSENLSALVQRFPLNIELEKYKLNELKTIINQFLLKQYPKEKIDNNILIEIVENCRYTPRLALTLLREYIYIRNWQQVKNNNNIIKNGITKNDLKVLNYLKEVSGASKLTLAKFLNIESKTYEFEIEPYLINQKLIMIENKRTITELGKKFLKEIKND